MEQDDRKCGGSRQTEYNSTVDTRTVKRPPGGQKKREHKEEDEEGMFAEL